MFVTADNPGEAVSTVKALSKAQLQGQKLYHVTLSNLSTALAEIRLDDATIQEIRDSIATGKEVITHTDSIGVPGWDGAGYVVFDPAKGDGAWRIGGGWNGSNIKADKSMLSSSLSAGAAKNAAVGYGSALKGFFSKIVDAMMKSNDMDTFMYAIAMAILSSLAGHIAYVYMTGVLMMAGPIALLMAGLISAVVAGVFWTIWMRNPDLDYGS